MKTKKFMSNLLAMLAMLAVCMTAFSLTACSDDDDDNKGRTDETETTISIEKVWEFETSPNPTQFVSAMYDFSVKGKVTSIGKYTASRAADLGLSADKYYIVSESEVTITLNEDGKSGTITQDEMPYPITFSDLTATSVKFTVLGNDYTCKVVTEKIEAEKQPEEKPGREEIN